jgi:hypothetical protein
MGNDRTDGDQAARSMGPSRCGVEFITKTLGTPASNSIRLKAALSWGIRLSVPDRPDGAGDETERASGRLKVGDVGQPLGEQPDQLRVERAAGTDLLGVVWLESPAVEGDAGLSLRFVVGNKGGRNLASLVGLCLLCWGHAGLRLPSRANRSVSLSRLQRPRA